MSPTALAERQPGAGRKGVFFTQALAPVTIAPDESKSFKVAWDPAGLEAGKYRVEGYFLGVEGLKPAVDVEVSP